MLAFGSVSNKWGSGGIRWGLDFDFHLTFFSFIRKRNTHNVAMKRKVIVHS